MAFIQNNLEEEDPLNPQGAPQAQGGGAAPLVGSGSNAAGTGAQAQGSGSAGGGGWTNIQSYLNANQNNSGSAQALSNEVSGQFDQERDAFKTDSSKFLGDAEKQINETKVTTDQADGLVKKGAAAYDWGGQQKTDYTDSVNKVQNFLGQGYQGPRSYAYGFNAQTQKLGGALKDDNSGFDTLMNNVYSKGANSPLTSGQFQLQKQLDVNNQSLVDTRKNLADRYQGLETERDDVVKNTTDKLTGYESDYRNTQENLKTFLGNQANAYDTSGAQAEADARAGYKQTFEKDKSGLANIFNGGIDDAAGGGTENMASRGVWGDQQGDNLTWQEAQREQDLGRTGNTDFWYNVLNEGRGGNTAQSLARQRELQDKYAGNASGLSKFYGEQDTKYAGTADEQKRAYNTIQDFLKSDAKRKEQGFRVRG